MCCFIFNNKYFQFYVHYTTCCYRHLGRITAIPDGSKLFSFTLIILAIPPTWLALPPTWLVLLCFYLHYFQLIYLTVLPLPTLCPLLPLWYQSHSFLAGDSVVVFSVSLSVSTRNFGTPLLCSLLTIIGLTLVVK